MVSVFLSLLILISYLISVLAWLFSTFYWLHYSLRMERLENAYDILCYNRKVSLPKLLRDNDIFYWIFMIIASAFLLLGCIFVLQPPAVYPGEILTFTKQKYFFLFSYIYRSDMGLFFLVSFAFLSPMFMSGVLLGITINIFIPIRRLWKKFSL